MALYVPAGARRRRLVLSVAAGLVLGLVIGFVAGRATSTGVGDRVAHVQALAEDAATSLARIPIEYEQALADQGGESTDTITGAIDAAQAKLEVAYQEAIWLGPNARDATDAAFAELVQAVDDGASTEVFAAAVDDVVGEIHQAFGLAD